MKIVRSIKSKQADECDVKTRISELVERGFLSPKRVLERVVYNWNNCHSVYLRLSFLLLDAASPGVAKSISICRLLTDYSIASKFWLKVNVLSYIILLMVHNRVNEEDVTLWCIGNSFHFSFVFHWIRANSLYINC